MRATDTRDHKSVNTPHIVIVKVAVDAFDANTAARKVREAMGARIGEGYDRYGDDDHLTEAVITDIQTVWIDTPDD